jgi:hypothetical protein
MLARARLDAGIEIGWPSGVFNTRLSSINVSMPAKFPSKSLCLTEKSGHERTIGFINIHAFPETLEHGSFWRNDENASVQNTNIKRDSQNLTHVAEVTLWRGWRWQPCGFGGSHTGSTFQAVE